MLIKTSSFLTMFTLVLLFLQLSLFARCRLLMLGMIGDADEDFFFSYDVYSFPVFLQLSLFARCRLLMLGMIRDADQDFFFSYDVYSLPVLSSAISLCKVSFAYAGDDKRC